MDVRLMLRPLWPFLQPHFWVDDHQHQNLHIVATASTLVPCSSLAGSGAVEADHKVVRRPPHEIGSISLMGLIHWSEGKL